MNDLNPLIHRPFKPLWWFNDPKFKDTAPLVCCAVAIVQEADTHKWHWSILGMRTDGELESYDADEVRFV